MEQLISDVPGVERPTGALQGKPPGSPLRYMGTKRSLAPLVRREIDLIRPQGRIVDLFAGLGCVAQAMASSHSVIVNDGLTFTGPIARARFIEPKAARPRLGDLLAELYPYYLRRQRSLRSRFRHEIISEGKALRACAGTLASYIKNAKHVGSSDSFRRRARNASGRHDAGHYALVSLYFSAGYFSTEQAVELDALRFAIDTFGQSEDWLLAAWLSAAAAVINAPGHAAQFLKPTTESAFTRIRRQWSRKIWPLFVSKLEEITPVGSRSWRERNCVRHGDALELLENSSLRNVGAVYADPPYTKDQYSRYYHLYETLYRYDYPDSTGAGRYRTDRFTSAFSQASAVENAFQRLFERVAAMGVPLVLSYPARSLLSKKKIEVRDLLRRHFRMARELTIDHLHSTMGASKGHSHLSAQEQIFVCYPSRQ